MVEHSVTTIRPLSRKPLQFLHMKPEIGQPPVTPSMPLKAASMPETDAQTGRLICPGNISEKSKHYAKTCVNPQRPGQRPWEVRDSRDPLWRLRSGCDQCPCQRHPTEQNARIPPISRGFPAGIFSRSFGKFCFADFFTDLSAEFQHLILSKIALDHRVNLLA